jgi:hypothetical protein
MLAVILGCFGTPCHARAIRSWRLGPIPSTDCSSVGHAKSVLLIVEGDNLDQPGDFFGRGSALRICIDLQTQSKIHFSILRQRGLARALMAPPILWMVRLILSCLSVLKTVRR